MCVKVLYEHHARVARRKRLLENEWFISFTQDSFCWPEVFLNSRFRIHKVSFFAGLVLYDFFLMQKYLVSLSSNKIFFMILKSIDKCIVNKRRKYWISLEFFVKVIKVWKNCNRLKATVKRATNTCNLILNIAAERVNKHVMPVLQSTFKPVLKQIKVPVSWVNTDLTDWIRLCRSHAIQRHYVTCCKTSLPWAGKTRNIDRCKK